MPEVAPNADGECTMSLCSNHDRGSQNTTERYYAVILSYLSFLIHSAQVVRIGPTSQPQKSQPHVNVNYGQI